MEKRIAGIMRWLERCLKSCKAGALESALLDAECARADMDRLRNEIWSKLERRYGEKKTARRVAMSARVVLGAGIAVLAAATPVALVQEIAAQEEQRQQDSVILEWVTPDERLLLTNLRKHLSENDVLVSIPEPAKVPVKSLPEIPAVRAVNLPAERIEPEEQKKEKDISYEQIISLVQVGEKAMKDEEPAIKIEKK
jgi:hypothetical protein